MDYAALKNQAMGLGRGGVWFLAGAAVGYGLVNGETAIGIAGAVLTLIGGGLTGVANTNNSIVQAASQVPEVKAMSIADPGLVAAAKSADPETRVTSLPKEGS